MAIAAVLGVLNGVAQLPQVVGHLSAYIAAGDTFAGTAVGVLAYFAGKKPTVG